MAKKLGRPADYKVGLVDKGPANARGVRRLVLECRDVRGLVTRWVARFDARGELLGKITVENQEAISRHAPRVRAMARELARAAILQQELAMTPAPPTDCPPGAVAVLQRELTL